MKKFLPIITFAVFVLTLFGNNAYAQVEETGPYLGMEYGKATGLGETDVRFTTARIISAALGLLGTVALVLVLYAGFMWMTAGGDDEKAGSAKKILYAAVIGLVIILAAYSITRFVMSQLFKATTGYDYYTTGDIY
ncbi:MAG: hypothetical protein HZC26_00275 [Candidatus Magasanikbacteria bacterium]|nr:hypothetical protein [Candidatus Magasanikbacteria bacterium]